MNQKTLRKIIDNLQGAVPLVVVLVILPLFAEGSEYELQAKSFQKWSTFGIYSGMFAKVWAQGVLRWCERTNRPFDYGFPWYICGSMLSAIPMAFVGYFLIRLFDHPGQWDIILGQFSSATAMSVLINSFLLAAVMANAVSAFEHYRQGTNILFSGDDEKPTTRNQARLTAFLFPLGVLLLLWIATQNPLNQTTRIVSALAVILFFGLVLGYKIGKRWPPRSED